jgi:hypothetical protein
VQYAPPPLVQQFSMSPPQVKVPAVHDPMSHVRVPEHMSPSAWQSPRMQQPPAEQVPSSQQGCPSPPHAVNAPPSQTVPLIVAEPSPGARQLAASQHPPPRHVSPGQQVSPGYPHATQVLPEQVPTAHAAPSATQRSRLASQHPLVHEPSSQHACPGPPQG